MNYYDSQVDIALYVALLPAARAARLQAASSQGVRIVNIVKNMATQETGRDLGS